MKTTQTLFLTLFLLHSLWSQRPGQPELNGLVRQGASIFFQQDDQNQDEVSANQFFDLFGQQLGLGQHDQMVLVSETTDQLGWTHSRYVQQYAGVDVYGSGLILHHRDGRVNKANGHLYSGIQLDVVPRLSPDQAMLQAKDVVQGNSPVVDEPRLVIFPGEHDDTFSPMLTYQIHCTSERLIEDKDVFIHAHEGGIISMLTHICHVDEQGSANTLYSGTQTITTDNTGGGYRLKESGRPIHTLNLNHAIDLGSVAEFTDSDNQWTDQVVVLRNVTFNAVGPGWWQDVPGDNDPDIYIVIKDGSNTTVATTPVMMDVKPPFSIPLQLTLTNPPYSINIFEDDGGSDEWGGPFNISASLGTKNFSILGNTGTYETVLENNPALDAHWGMEKTYDYFLNVHNRDSYDGMGGEMIAYVHFALGWPNAFWSNNSLKLGDGNGIATNHRTYINVLSHEITHGVINTNGGGGLDYQGESGALNESFADIFGTAVEHYAKPATADWLHGEEGSLVPGEYVRSMEDPRSRSQPDTYGPNDSYWVNTQDTFDFGGVHVNSGVQNYWFYLVSEGGSGVNENGYAYTVDGIGLEKAEQIAYRNLTQYISASTMSNYEDSRMGAIMSAEDLYGAGSPEVETVKRAWAAVGVGSFDPGPTCMGLVELYDPVGMINDGSGMFDYGNNADCTWKIYAGGYDEITLDFAEFDVAAGDTLFVYDGQDSQAPVLATLTGNALPGKISSSDAHIFLKFVTDGSGVSSGWALDYSSVNNMTCSGQTLLTDLQGDIEDGSGADPYSNASNCRWLIQPPNAQDITLTFTSFQTEEGYDYVRVYDGEDENAALLGEYSGGTLPGSVMSSGGSLFVWFESDDLIRQAGWEASYVANELTGIIDQLRLVQLQIIPNPTNGLFTINIPESDQGTIRVINPLGQLVWSWSGGAVGQVQSVDLQDQPTGVYQVQWISTDQMGISRVVKR